jgi:hypothetical protein
MGEHGRLGTRWKDEMKESIEARLASRDGEGSSPIVKSQSRKIPIYLLTICEAVI